MAKGLNGGKKVVLGENSRGPWLVSPWHHARPMNIEVKKGRAAVCREIDGDTAVIDVHFPVTRKTLTGRVPVSALSGL